MQALKVPLYPYHDIVNYTNNLITFLSSIFPCHFTFLFNYTVIFLVYVANAFILQRFERKA